MGEAMSQSQIIDFAEEFAEANYEFGMYDFADNYENKEWVEYVGTDTLMGTLSRMVKEAHDLRTKTGWPRSNGPGGNPFKSE